MTMEIERFTGSHHPGFEHARRIRHTVFVIGQNVPEEEELDLWDPFSIHLLVRLDGQLAGTCRVRPEEVDDPEHAVWWRVGRMAVLQEYQRRGLGRAMLAEIEKLARIHKVHGLVLNGQTQAQGFYENNGYRVVDPEIFYEADIPHVKMAKILDQA